MIRNAIFDALNVRLLRALTRTEPFGIISNNCWGAGLYRDIDLQFATPFIGTLVFPPCFLKLAADVRSYLAQPLVFIDRSRYCDHFKYPVALLGDIEIHFMHYASREEALSKWTRRVARLPTSDGRLFFKFCDHHTTQTAHLRKFDSLPVRNKICFTARRDPPLACRVWLSECESAGRVPNGHALHRLSLRYFQAARWLNGGGLRPSSMHGLCI